MNALKVAIFNKLKGDATLTGLLANGTASIYQSVAPQEADPPYVVFNQQAETDAYTLSQRSWENSIYLVKAVTQGTSPAAAGTIAERIDTVLTDGALSVSGHTHMYTRRTATVDYPEVDRGVTYRHAGGLFRIYVS